MIFCLCLFSAKATIDKLVASQKEETSADAHESAASVAQNEPKRSYSWWYWRRSGNGGGGGGDKNQGKKSGDEKGNICILFLVTEKIEGD